MVHQKNPNVDNEIPVSQKRKSKSQRVYCVLNLSINTTYDEVKKQDEEMIHVYSPKSSERCDAINIQ